MRVRGFIVLAGALALASCTPDWATQNEANVIIRAEVVEAQAGGAEGAGGQTLRSDVKDTSGSVFDDIVTVTVRNLPKDPNISQSMNFNDVVLERYEVKYVRSDGRSVEGVDVPYRITGNLTQLVTANDSAGVTFTVVRHQAKSEPPLVNLVNGGGMQIVTMFAEMTLFGHTTTGKAVQTSASLAITFGDFGAAS